MAIPSTTDAKDHLVALMGVLLIGFA